MRLFLAALLCVATPAWAQHNHAQGHSEYQNWSSGKVASCCSNQDCGTVKESDIRQTSAGAEIKIDNQWCPVLPEHFLTRGKSPDWSTAHACIRVQPTENTCDRLLCFLSAGGI